MIVRCRSDVSSSDDDDSDDERGSLMWHEQRRRIKESLSRTGTLLPLSPSAKPHRAGTLPPPPPSVEFYRLYPAPAAAQRQASQV